MKDFLCCVLSGGSDKYQRWRLAKVYVAQCAARNDHSKQQKNLKNIEVCGKPLGAKRTDKTQYWLPPGDNHESITGRDEIIV